MALPPEVQNWLNNAIAEAKSAGMPEEKVNVLTEVFSNDKVASFAKQSVHAASDYNRKMNDLGDKIRQLETYEAQLGAWKTGMESRLSTAEAKAALADEYATKLNATRAEIDRLRTEGYTNFTVDTPPVVPPAIPTPPAYTFKSREDFQRELDAVLSAKEQDIIRIPAIANDIAREHQRLFGELPAMQPLVDKAFQTKRSLIETWESEYKVPERRAQLDAEARELEINKRVQEQLSRERSTLVAQGQTFRTGDPRSPVLNLAARSQTPPANNSPANNPAPIFNNNNSAGVEEAVAAYNSGKYQQKYPGQS